MPSIKIVLDNRKKMKDNKYNLSIRVCNKRQVQYLPMAKITVKQYNQVFVNQSMDKESVEFRAKAAEFKARCENIFSEMSVFNPTRFREKVYSKDKELPKTMVLKDLFDYYIQNYKGITIRTRKHFRLSINFLKIIST